MEFMGYHIVDITIVALVLFLAIKGLVNGFTKELFNFLIIVGGVTLAARYNTLAVQFIEKQNLLPKIPDEFTNIFGFILIILSVWIVFGTLSSIISRLTPEVNGFISRLFGYILSAGRYIFIFSLIIFGINQSDFFKESATKFSNETKLFKPMVQLGSEILKFEGNQSSLTTDNNLTITDHNSSN